MCWQSSNRRRFEQKLLWGTPRPERSGNFLVDYYVELVYLDHHTRPSGKPLLLFYGSRVDPYTGRSGLPNSDMGTQVWHPQFFRLAHCTTAKVIHKDRMRLRLVHVLLSGLLLSRVRKRVKVIATKIRKLTCHRLQQQYL